MLRALLVALVAAVAAAFLPPGLAHRSCPSLGRRSALLFGAASDPAYVGTTAIPDPAFDAFDEVYNASVTPPEPAPKKKK